MVENVECLGLQPPVTDLFGKKGMAWFKEQELRPVYRVEADAFLRTVETIRHELLGVDNDCPEQASFFRVFLERDQPLRLNNPDPRRYRESNRDVADSRISESCVASSCFPVETQP
jgi:hypothetical protein